eukprot:s6301_g1.t1
MRAGGSAKAISDLRIFYKSKYTPAQPVPRSLSMAIFRHRTGPAFNPEAFTLQEIQDVAFLCKHNKSTGADGISYEAIQLLLQTSLSANLLEMFNTVLWGLRQVPPSWLSNHVTFLPKTSAPSCPGDLRPIVLSPTVAKVFTKALMLRLRSKLPPIRDCQVGGIAGRQTLDSVCAVQHAIKLAEEYNKTLFVIKLDITAAFDLLAHEALAAFLAEASGCREAELLLEIITNTRVTLSYVPCCTLVRDSVPQLQGSSYSAELFARCVDYYLAKTSSFWQEHEVTWLQSSDGRKMFLTPFADDLIILGTSREQAQRLLKDIEDTVNAIGLHFNAKKCKFLRPPGMSDRPLHLRNGQPLQAQDSLVFLGVLLAFNLTCYAVVAARMTQAEDSQDRIQAAPAHGEGQAVPGTSSPPSDSKGPKDDDEDAGSPVRTATKPDPTSTSPTSPKSPGTPSQKPDSTTATAAARVDQDSQLSDATLLHLKDWLGEEMKKIMQPGLRQLRDDNREVLKSLHEILGDKSKDLHEILEDKSKLDQIAGQVEVLEAAQISKIVQDVTWMGKVVNDESSTVIKIEKELADLNKDLSARRHASV